MCDCGKIIIASSQSLLNHILSDGKSGRGQCDDCSPYRKDGFSEVKRVLQKIKLNAEKGNLELSPDINLSYLKNLLEKQNRKCALTNVDLFIPKTSTSSAKGGRPAGRISMIVSVDRIDSSKGYIPGNIQMVTAQVNFGKSDFTQEEFDEMCRARVKILDSGVI
jgi:hypothetical protein